MVFHKKYVPCKQTVLLLFTTPLIQMKLWFYYLSTPLLCIQKIPNEHLDGIQIICSLCTIVFNHLTTVYLLINRTGWFRSTLGFDLLGFRSILVSICTRYQFQTAHYSIYTNSDLHSFRSALFSLCNFWICKDFALLSIRSAQISICTDFDLHVFRYANQF